ncbi:hypothetical protein [Kitasatospora sp. NPDC094016]|uniref:hypothetical protein n=1 Tax=Kitasatospora sp. NPDC094016 TaxID=3154986 RepID=UPI00332A79C1
MSYEERRCEYCEGPIPEGVRSDSRYCSKAHRTAAWRRRTAAGREDQRTVDIPARQLADALTLAAGRTATALGAGVAADPVDLDVIAVNARALVTRARAAHPDTDWDDTTPVPTVAVLPLVEPSRDTSRTVPPPLEEVGRLPENLRGAAPITRWEQSGGVFGDDWVRMAKDATGADGPDPDRRPPGGKQPSRDASTSQDPATTVSAKNEKRPRLTRAKAIALLDTADLVKDADYRENGTWHLVTADGTVICHLHPAYRHLRRNGWNAWAHGNTPNRHDHYPNRERAAAAGAESWLRQVTARPRR